LPDDEVRTIAVSVSRYAPGGPDPLEQAWRAIQSGTYTSRYEQFIALVHDLQRSRPEQPIVLPLERIATLMGCAWESVRGYRQKAAKSGLIYRVCDPTPHRKAAQYRVSLTTTETLSFTPTPTTPHYPHYGSSGNPHSGNQQAPHSGNEPSGEGWEQVARLARRGFRLFPCRRRSKLPAIKEWQHKATCEIAQLGEWFEKFEACNWAIATGKDSQIFVLDIDGAEGLQSFADCCVDWKAVADATVGVKTGNGSHLYFAHPGNEVRNSCGKVAPDLDIRGDGGYCVVPPSMHENGEPYFWLGGDEAKQITTAPDWLVERVSALDCQSQSAGNRPGRVEGIRCD
jgi:hypothetical protein